jgi:hypothetical protein
MSLGFYVVQCERFKSACGPEFVDPLLVILYTRENTFTMAKTGGMVTYAQTISSSITTILVLLRP